MNNISELPTYDLWWTRTWNRWMGTPLNKQGKLQESPRNDAERSAMNEVLNRISQRLTNEMELPEGDKIFLP